MHPIKTKLAGTSFGDCQENIRNYANPAKLGINEYDLIREPDNIHDPNAVWVGLGPFKFGYIPAPLAQTIAPMMDNGQNLVARHVARNRHPYHTTVGLTVKLIELTE